jgi:prenyltransferase beta subunit
MKFFTFNFNRKKKEKSMSSTAKPIKVKPGAVYIQDCVTNELSKLYTLDLATGKATFVSEIVTEVYDIAFVGSQLYGLDRDGDKTRLVKIDLNSGDATVIGDIGNACAGLAYNRQRNTLYATTAKQLIAINLETGKGTPVVTVADKDHNCAEVAFDADGKAYITLIGYNKKKLLASLNLETSKVHIIGNIGFPNIASMEFVGDVLYGVTGNFFNLGKNGQLIRIDTTTGKGTLVTMTEPKGRWAGISIYEPATVVTTEITPEVKSDEKSETTKEETSQPIPAAVKQENTSQGIPAAVKQENTSQGTPAIVSQESKTITEEGMSILTIDTKNNCYVINPDQMNNLQQNVATSFTFDKGTFDIKIIGGRYKYAKAKTEGEPFVLLWIYGVDGSKFINKTTGYEVGATWTTLNGANDNLQLEVKQRAVLNALFFDVNNNDNSGSIDLLISSNKPFFNPQTLTVDSKRNSYVLDENQLASLKQSGTNSIELNPGNYRLKIREGNATYWSDNKKFNLEPWALIWVKGGKFITKLTGIEVEETWTSLNGFKDEVVLEVKEKTTLTGLFVDTYKEDNEGQIILAIESVSATTVTNVQGSGESTSREAVGANSSETVTNVQGSGESTSREAVGANSSETVTNVQGTGESTSREAVGASSSPQFTFRFNEDELKKKWEEQLQEINASIKVIDENDVKLEGKYWDQLEQWLLKSYEKQFKNLAIEVAKVRFTMDAYTQQMEFSLNQQLQGWSSYLDKLVENRINVEISNKINQQINQYVDQTFEQKIRNNIGLIINNILRKQELNQHIEQQVNQQIDSAFEQKIRSNLGLIINNLVNKQELNQYIDRHVDGQIDSSFEQKIRNNINLITQNLVNDNTDLNQYVSQQIDNTYEQKVQNNLHLITQNIVNNNEELNRYIDQRLQQTVTNNSEVNNEIVNLVSNSTEINNKIENLRNEWNRTFLNLATQHVDELSNIIGGTDTFNRVITQKLVNNNTELEQYVSQQIDNTYEQKVQNNLHLITQNIVNNNEELNRYIDQRLQQTVTNNSEVNNEIVNLVSNSNEINNKIENLRNEWNRTFLNLATQHVDELSNIIGGTDTFNRVITQKLVNNNTELEQYVSQQIDNTYEQKVQNNLHLITQKIVNNNEELNRYIDQRLQQTVTNNSEVNNEIVNLVSNSNEINNKIENLRNEWNRTFLNLATQHVDELSNIIGGTDTFNRVITQKLVNNNTELEQYVSQQIDNTYEQKVQNNLHLITQNIVNNNEELNRYIDQRLQQTCNQQQ